MKKQNRVLAYQKAIDMNDKDLAEITGGKGVNTFERTQQGTGQFPGPTDVIVDQNYD